MKPAERILLWVAVVVLYWIVLSIGAGFVQREGVLWNLRDRVKRLETRVKFLEAADHKVN